MNKAWTKWVAFICCILSMVTFLFLPYASSYGYSVSLFDLVSRSGEAFGAIFLLFLIWFIVMIICVLVDPRASAGIICIVGSLYPLLLAAVGSASVDVSISSSSIGIGLILSPIFGILAAVFCFMCAAANRIGGGQNYGYSQRSRNNYYQDQYQDQYQYPRRNQYSRQNQYTRQNQYSDQYSDQYSNQYSDQYSNENQYSKQNQYTDKKQYPNQNQSQNQNKSQNQYQSQNMGDSDW